MASPAGALAAEAVMMLQVQSQQRMPTTARKKEGEAADANQEHEQIPQQQPGQQIQRGKEEEQPLTTQKMHIIIFTQEQTGIANRQQTQLMASNAKHHVDYNTAPFRLPRQSTPAVATK